MADPICRWRNSSIKQLNEFNLLLPFRVIDKQEGRKIVERNWALLGGRDFFNTPYQLAAQMGIYYEDDSFMYPRFNRLINLEACDVYMQNWGRKYYAPNPYTRSMQQDQKPVVINKFLVNWVLENGDGCDFVAALRAMFVDSIGNTDILINMINSFMDVTIEDNKLHLKDSHITEKYPQEEVYLSVSPNDKKAFFDFVGIQTFSSSESSIKNTATSQKIFFGAPGTGKSHEVKRLTKELLDNGEKVDLPNVFRTTFHPDTDYASFVGCYKPTMKPTSKEEKTLTGKDEEIVYEYVPQVFTDAYVYAYSSPTEQTYLVIEEINRGNCAQIFGDLFQLLDRKNGVSEYTIKADKDLAKHLVDVLGADSAGIKDGKLCLPDNLHILATMNTSDQSLFPMDSAFKRRWEWEYVPINYGDDIPSGSFEITIDDKTYPWVAFIQKVNEKIFDLTQSEDKQMGNFFIKNSIGEDEFKSKVMFYLWYEVLRDETGNNKYFFNTVEGKPFTFKDLYGSNAKETIKQFMEYLGVPAK